MKSFNQHSDKKSENLQEDPFDDLTDLLWVGAAGAGLWGLSKGWDKFGKDAVASLPFASDKMKADKITRKKEKDDEKAATAKTLAGPTDAEKDQAKLDKAKADQDAKTTKADAAALDFKKDEDDIIISKSDAAKYKKIAGKAPSGWETGEDGKVVRKDEKPKETEKETKLVPKGTKMTITESNELQAIMALDDAGIKAEINRKGQVVIKKKDKKKAHRALEKSFTKGGWPPLKLEDVDWDRFKIDEGWKKGTYTITDVKTGKVLGKFNSGAKAQKAADDIFQKGDYDAVSVEVDEGIEIEEASNKKAMKKVADELEAMADKGGAEAPALFSIASNLRKGRLPTGQKVSKKVSAVFKKHGIREELRKPRTAYEIVSEARAKVIKNKPKWEPEDSEPRLS